MASSRAREIPKEFSKSLQQTVTSLPDCVRLTPNQRDSTLEQFNSIGSGALNSLLGGYAVDGVTLGYGSLEPDTAPTSVQITCEEGIALPFEFWRLLDPLPSARTLSIPAYETAIRMLGFGATSYRSVVLGRPEITQEVDPDCIRFYWYGGLRSARHEAKKLAQIFGEGFLGPEPAKGRSEAELVEFILAKPGRSQLPAAVEHFSCHHERSKDLLTLRVSRFRGRRHITSTDLVRLAEGRPLIPGLSVLNACGTQAISQDRVSDLVTSFFNRGRTAIVATWCDVPELVAAKMGEFFYSKLAQNATVEQALRYARLQLLLHYNNPLGLLYTSFGDGSFRLGRMGG